MGTRESHSGRETRTRRVKDKQSIQAYGRVREAGGYLKILPDSQLCSQNILILTLMSAYSSAMIRGNQQLQTFGPIVYLLGSSSSKPAGAASSRAAAASSSVLQLPAAYCSCQGSQEGCHETAGQRHHKRSRTPRQAHVRPPSGLRSPLWFQ